MRKIIMMTAVLFSLAAKVNAECELDPTKAAGKWLASIPAALLTVDASQPADTSNYIAQFDSATQGYNQEYIDCHKGTAYGKSAINLSGQDSSTRIYKTDIDGIGIKLLWNNGGAFGNYPSSSTYTPSDGADVGRFIYPAASFFRIQFYKISESLHLTNPDGEQVLPAGQIAYNWLKSDSPSNFTQQLNIGRITVISTPSCTYTSSQTVDFGTVTSNSLSAEGIQRPLPFEISCRTDYGYYSASATLTTTTPAADNSYIKVTDAGGHDDRMGIKIRNDQGQDLKVDGSSSETVSNMTSMSPAKFNWTAILIPTGSTHPTDGDFSARAEIIMQLR
ncbi:fimbrial protein [Siccibacter colletis]|uniref:fimbrial protein n=1 Tax=Siccibacter colletis TaxID=1505757 RepID=UPI003CF74D16